MLLMDFECQLVKSYVVMGWGQGFSNSWSLQFVCQTLHM